ncbi:MAG: TPM domain-containing protein [Candidatus Buchananbacteria bacterium]
MKKAYLILLAVIVSGNCWALDVPQLSGRVNDYANILTLQQRDQLEARLKTFEETTSNQVVILTVASLEGEDDVAFGVKVFKAWQLGQKSKDNGVLWLGAVAKSPLKSFLVKS